MKFARLYLSAFGPFLDRVIELPTGAGNDFHVIFGPNEAGKSSILSAVTGFLRQTDRETPEDKALHLVCDNYATHKRPKVNPKVKEWLEKHPRFHVHFTPTSASWLNMVERFFRSVPELIGAIEEYIAVHSAGPSTAGGDCDEVVARPPSNDSWRLND